MKNFFASLLGTLTGLAIFAFGLLVILFGVIGMAVSMGEPAAPAFERGAYLVFDLSANITDAPATGLSSVLSVSGDDSLQLRRVTAALEAAAKDDRVAGLLLRGEVSPLGYGSGFAALREVRTALARFRDSGKPIQAYLTSVTTQDYYLASVANEVVLDPYGMILMPGLASEPMFFAGALDKLGVNVQVTRVGKYKSAVEPFTRADMSPENREEVQKLLDDVWGSLVAEMAASRGLTPADIQRVVDTEALIRADAARAAKLVDRVAYLDEVIAGIRAKTGPASAKASTFKQVSLAAYARTQDSTRILQGTGSSSRSIGLVYAEGDIVDGEGAASQVGATRFARNLRAMRQDDDIRAIVLRINSPGGSATASEAIQREIRLAREVKPVVVSMGSYAASGGYWIATYGNRIFAEPTTITGSIGVFGLQFDVQELAGKLGVTFDSVKTGRYGDALTISRPKTAEELAIFQRMVDWIYAEFVAKVAEGRRLTPEAVEGVAQGRVWSGAEAQKVGLVDEIGGLDAALRHAAQLANLGAEYRVVEYPEELDLAETIAQWIEGRPAIGTRAGVIGQVIGRVERDLRALQAFNDPRGVYARLPIGLTVR